jgi:hypothetical protein
MPSTQPDLLSPSGTAHPDTPHWLEGLDLEPEACDCLSHGHELPCGQCDEADCMSGRKELP